MSKAFVEERHTYVAVQVVPTGATRLTVLNRQVASSRGIQIIHCGEYKKNSKTNRSMLGAAREHAVELAKALNMGFCATSRLTKNQRKRIKRMVNKRALVDQCRVGKCAVCHKGFNNLEFHHIDPRLKRFCIGRETNRSGSIERMKNEIEKCAMVCGSCHDQIHDDGLVVVLKPIKIKETINATS